MFYIWEKKELGFYYSSLKWLLTLKKIIIALLSLMLYVSVAFADTTPTITTTKLPSGKALWHYSEQLSAKGTEPIKWFLFSGHLPDGLTLTDNGLISGTPSRAETAYFSVEASNDIGYAIKSLSITIYEEPISEILSGGGCNVSVFGLFILPVVAVLLKKYYVKVNENAKRFL